MSDDEVIPLPEPAKASTRRPLTVAVIEDELHTERPAQQAAWRAVDAQEEKEFKPVAPDFATAANCALDQDDWMYGVGRKTAAPLRCGMNFSYNALYRGTGVDERALPNHMRGVMLKETEAIVKKRRKAAKQRSQGFTVSKEFEEAIGLVRESTESRGRAKIITRARRQAS